MFKGYIFFLRVFSRTFFNSLHSLSLNFSLCIFLVSLCQSRSTVEMSRVCSCLENQWGGHFFLRTPNIKFSWSCLLAQSTSLDKNPLTIGVCMHTCVGGGSGMLDSRYSGAELGERF